MEDELKEQRARIDVLEEGLRFLIQQVEKSNAIDDHGHPIKNFQALHDARKALEEDYDDTKLLRSDLVAALKLVLMFHSGKPFGQKARTGWYAITGKHDATTKVMCDHIRKVLND